MRYYVIGEDGQKYGPADVATLNSWITEGRLLPTQQLEDETSGLRLAAGAVQGLNFPLQGAARVNAPTPPTGNPYEGAYTRPQMGSASMYGQKELTTSWVLFGIGFVCCGVILWPIGISYAIKAEQAGNPGAQAAKIANIIMTVIGVLGIAFYIVAIVMAASNGGFRAISPR
ncbi:MAG: hypothetical protein P4L46_20495 [Fimbriimonas sp.]|nr:hypothetical protein [Fimbriimonas sp.]